MSGMTACPTDIYCAMQQFLAEFFKELDNDGLEVTRFYHEDGVFAVGAAEYAGHARIREFYAERLARVRAERADAIRTTRHTFVNLRVSPLSADQVMLDCINLTYAGDGAPPVHGLLGPSVVSDCRIECRRAADGGWKIARFEGQAILIGADPLMNTMALKPGS